MHSLQDWKNLKAKTRRRALLFIVGIVFFGISFLGHRTMAAPSSEMIEIEEDLGGPTPEQHILRPEQMLLEVTPAPETNSERLRARAKEELFFLTKTESFAIYSGFFGTWNSDGHDSVTKIMFGVAYTFAFRSFGVFTVSGDALLGSMGAMGLDRRWYFFQRSLRRPFLAAGLGFRFDRWRGIGDFGDVNNLHGQLGVGMEDMITSEVGVCVLFQASGSFRGGDVRVKVGFFWVW